MTQTNAAEQQVRNFDAFSFLARFAPLIFLLLLMLVFAVIEPRFLSSINLFNVMRQVSITGLLAIGMTFVILTAGIDLSVGSLLAFAGLVCAAVAKGGMQDRFTVGDGLELMTPQGNLRFTLEHLQNAQGQAQQVAPGDGHILYLPLPADVQLEYGLLMRDL